MSAEHPIKTAYAPAAEQNSPAFAAAQERVSPLDLPVADEAVGLELSAQLLREWGPLLKPTGLGLLIALHSFEERTPGHPFLGWAHCTQAMLVSYLDSSQDTIARYTNLLLTCGLLHVDEVETIKGKQKLYRAARGLPLPSVALIEYLVFDADGWSRKHAAWLLDTFSPPDIETELGRIVAVLKRAYTVRRDAKGIANLISGERLTAPGAYLKKRITAVQPALTVRDYSASSGQVPAQPAATLSAPSGQVAAQPSGDLSAPCGQVPAAATTQPTEDYSASCGQVPPADLTASSGLVAATNKKQPRNRNLSASSGQPMQAALFSFEDLSAPSGQAQADPLEDSALCGQVEANRQEESASCGVVNNSMAKDSAQCGQVDKDGIGDSAPCGLPTSQKAEDSAPCGEVASNGVKDSAQCGEVTPHAGMESASCGGVDANVNNVNVDRLAINEKENVNVSAGELDELLAWGTRILGDGHSLDWHRRCIAQWGMAAYRHAIQTTQKAINGGKVANPGAYFTGVLRRTPREPGEESREPINTLQALVDITRSGKIAEPAADEDDAAIPDEGEPLAAIWQAALVGLRMALSADEYTRTLRYAALLELDRVGGWARLGLPNEYLCEQVKSRLLGPIRAALSQAVGVTVDVAVVTLAGQGGRPGAGGV